MPNLIHYKAYILIVEMILLQMKLNHINFNIYLNKKKRFDSVLNLLI
jgi:hypothetical protein